MKVSGRDAEWLATLEPHQVEAYLRSRGWHRSAQLDRKGEVWTVSTEGEEFELLLALDRTLRDYRTRIAEAFSTLQAVEDRPLLEIAMDVRRTMADAMRFCAEGPSIASGSMPVDAASALVAGCRDVVLAAACAALDKRPVFPNRKPVKALEYMERVILEAPRAGSFQLTLLSPVPPALVPGTFPEDDADPFERKVVHTLHASLSGLRTAIQHASSTGDAAAFFQGVCLGVHANLLEAAANLLEGSDAARVSVDIQWSPTRPVKQPGPTRIDLDAAAAPILREASKLFREREPTPDFELEGTVITVHGTDSMLGGRITIAAIVANALRHVDVELPLDTYRLAIDAHKLMHQVRVAGELVRSGRAHVLKDPRYFRVIDED